MTFGEIDVVKAQGAILAHSVRTAGISFKKGRVLSEADVAELVKANVAKVYAARVEAGDVHEDAAAARLADVVCGDGVTRQPATTGRANIYSADDGIVLVDAGLVRALNRLHEAVTLATLIPFQAVKAGQMVATVKIIPFSAPENIVDEAVELAASGALLSVVPFIPHKAGLVLTRTSGMKESLLEKSATVIRDRLERHGSTLGDVVEVAHTIDGVAAGIRQLKATGHNPVLVFGASAIVDRGDVVPAGLEAAGGQIVHLGMPVDPGNLLLLGTLSGEAVIGVPSCARSPKLNGFDWVLGRVLAGIDVRPQDIMDMGAGGLLMEIETRPSPREAGR
ncbi:molybdopterin-binding protein [Anderseniella sp. Alg231-50]|uniref:molybdopterin-binding protein n=1 Tax=Anderseniella sp. Alg231-50 TaxID=1922226 RepID=UPI00307C9671